MWLRFAFSVSTVDLEANGGELQSQLRNTSGKPLAEASLQPIVTAIAATGVPTSAIQVSVDGAKRGYGRSRNYSTGTIRVMLEKPSRSSLQAVVNAGENAAKTAKLFPQVYSQYRMNDCAALEKTAYTAAVKDAQRRAQAIAAATSVQLTEPPSIAEAFYSTFYPSACNPSNKSFYPPVGDSPYSEGFASYKWKGGSNRGNQERHFRDV